MTDSGRVLAEGKDVAELQRELRPRLRAVLSQAAAGITRTGLKSWNFGALPRGVPRRHRGGLPGPVRRRRPGRRAPVRDRGRGAHGHVGLDAAADLPARRRPSSRSQMACPPGPSWTSARQLHGGVAAMFADGVDAPRTT